MFGYISSKLTNPNAAPVLYQRSWSLDHNSTPPTFSLVSQFPERGKMSTSLISTAETVKVPQMAESITEGTLKQWNKAVGDFVKQDEEIATIETDKVGPVESLGD